MRVCYALLAIAATLRASGEASPLSGQAHLLKVTPLDSLQTTDAVEDHGRFMRSHRAIKEDADEDSVNGIDKEERGKPLFDWGILDPALNRKNMSRLFKRWAANEYTANEVAQKIGVDVNGGFGQTYSNLYSGYKSYLDGWRP